MYRSHSIVQDTLAVPIHNAMVPCTFQLSNVADCCTLTATPAAAACQVRATEPPDLGTVAMSCAVRQAVAIRVSLTNPTDKPLSLRAQYSCASLVGPAGFVAPPQEPAVFECYYAPLLLRKEEGVVRLISQEVRLHGAGWSALEPNAQCTLQVLVVITAANRC